MTLEEHRQGIDEIDRSILDLLARRRRIANQVIELKKAQSLPLRFASRHPKRKRMRVRTQTILALTGCQPG